MTSSGQLDGDFNLHVDVKRSWDMGVRHQRNILVCDRLKPNFIQIRLGIKHPHSSIRPYFPDCLSTNCNTFYDKAAGHNN